MLKKIANIAQINPIIHGVFESPVAIPTIENKIAKIPTIIPIITTNKYILIIDLLKKNPKYMLLITTIATAINAKTNPKIPLTFFIHFFLF